MDKPRPALVRVWPGYFEQVFLLGVSAPKPAAMHFAWRPLGFIAFCGNSFVAIEPGFPRELPIDARMAPF